MTWITVDTRRLDTIQGIVDGFIHIMPRRTMHKHWVQLGCWCEPEAYWWTDAGTIVVGHKPKKYPNDLEANNPEIHPKSR